MTRVLLLAALVIGCGGQEFSSRASDAGDSAGAGGQAGTTSQSGGMGSEGGGSPMARIACPHGHISASNIGAGPLDQVAISIVAPWEPHELTTGSASIPLVEMLRLNGISADFGSSIIDGADDTMVVGINFLGSTIDIPDGSTISGELGRAWLNDATKEAEPIEAISCKLTVANSDIANWP